MNKLVAQWIQVIFIVSLATVVLTRWRGAVGLTKSIGDLNVDVIGALKK